MGKLTIFWICLLFVDSPTVFNIGQPLPSLGLEARTALRLLLLKSKHGFSREATIGIIDIMNMHGRSLQPYGKETKA
jgi:hypothetical protein